MSARYIVMLHGFVNLPEGGQEHCEDGKPDGWNVWLRDNEPESGEPCETVDGYDIDFAEIEPAEIYAEGLAARFKCEIDRY